MSSLFSKERLVAPPHYSRWLIPPCAVATYLCIGQVYALSVFNLPLTRQLGIGESLPSDWKPTDIGWIFASAIFFLGISAALFGKWVQAQGPRKSGLVAASCWGSGFLIGALGIHLHELPLICLGYGVLGGCGLGIGYITPISTLMAWFPDRRGMAAGLAVMGFGGGALVAAPLSVLLMKQFASASSTGAAETWVVLGLGYLVVMAAAAFGYRLPPPSWKPPGSAPATTQGSALQVDVTPSRAITTKQFWCLWLVLCLNVTAGMGVLQQASPMIQEVFKGSIDAAAAAAFVGLLGVCNMVGRFLWASLSDKLGRRTTYACLFVLGALLYALVPLAAQLGSVVLFVTCFSIILSLYGGGLATIPAYLADVFGDKYVSAVHGRLLTAWSVAGLLGTALVSYLRELQIQGGIPRYQAYNTMMYVMAGLLIIAFLANWGVTSLAEERSEREPEPGGRSVPA